MNGNQVSELITNDNSFTHWHIDVTTRVNSHNVRVVLSITKIIDYRKACNLLLRIFKLTFLSAYDNVLAFKTEWYFKTKALPNRNQFTFTFSKSKRRSICISLSGGLECFEMANELERIFFAALCCLNSSQNTGWRGESVVNK